MPSQKSSNSEGDVYSLRGALDAFAELERAWLPRNLDRIIRRPVARTKRSRSSYARLLLVCRIWVSEARPVLESAQELVRARSNICVIPRGPDDQTVDRRATIERPRSDCGSPIPAREPGVCQPRYHLCFGGVT